MLADWKKIFRQYIIGSSAQNHVLAPTKALLDMNDLNFLEQGFFSTVYKHKRDNIVIKEGRWNLDITLPNEIRIPLPTNSIKDMLAIFGYSFLPEIQEIYRQFSQYEVMAQYFGYNAENSGLATQQRCIRQRLDELIAPIEQHFHFSIHPHIYKLLDDDVLFYSFLPEEFLFIGETLGDIAETRPTYFLVQEFIPGKKLAKVPIKELSLIQKKQLALFAFLSLALAHEKKLLIDTRPQEILPTNDWFQKTGNIIIPNEDGVKFIDTRWLWEIESNFVSRGLLIPELIIDATKNTLNSLLRYV